MNPSKKTIVAAFDFDGTLTRGDSLLPFLLHYAGVIKFTLGMLKMSPVLGGYALRLIQNDVAKVKLLKQFLGGVNISIIEQSGQVFAESKLPKLERENAMKRLRWHQAQGHMCVLVSASLIHYLEPWARNAGFDHIIASRLETDASGQISGNLSGGNCFGVEKAKRLKKLLADEQTYSIYAYGDSRGDKEMLEMADYAYYKIMPED